MSSMHVQGDKVKIVKGYCADDMYVGLCGEVIEEFDDFKHSVRIKVELPEDNPKYYLGNTPIFPPNCLEEVSV